MLIVDDDRVHRQLVRRFLGDEYDIAEAESAQGAVASCEEVVPDLVLLDYRLPDDTGLSVLPVIREHGCPVIMLTGEGDEQVAVSAIRGGAHDYLRKDRLDGDRLRRAVDYALHNQAMQVAMAEAAKQRDLLAEAVEQAAEAIVITDPEGTIELVNAAFERQTGYRAEEVVGRTPRLLRSSEHDDDFYQDLWTTIRAGGTWSGRIINRRKDGTHVHIDSTISPLKSPHGRIVHFLAFQKDVTREVELERQLGASQRLEALGHLAGGIAHDFNNLMTVILSNVELVKDALPPDSEHLGKLDEVRDSALSGRSLTKRLLAFGRRQVLRPKVLLLNDVVSEMEGMISRVLGDDIELTVRLAPDIRNVKADPTQLQSILLNLSLNARDAMPDGGQLIVETSEVEVDDSYQGTHPGSRPGRFVVLSVTDTGIGMDEETKRRVFEPFFSTKEEGTGSGLGLAMVYGTVKQSGGNIWVYSERGAGSTFKIYLPAVKSVAEPASAEREASPTPVRGSKILLVEDQDAVRRSVHRMLRRAGYEVHDVADPRVAVDLLKDGKLEVDLLVSDVMMPGLSGLELVELVADANPTLRVLFVSGHSADVVFKQKTPTLRHAFLEKPFTLNEMIDAIAGLLAV